MRVTADNTTKVLVSLPAAAQPGGAYDNADDWRARSFVVRNASDTGVVLLKKGAAGDDPTAVDMSDAFRWDFAKAWLTYVCEPGRALFCTRATADVVLDVLEGGER